MMTLHWHFITDPFSPWARQAFDLYETSFPVEQRDPVGAITGMMQKQGTDHPQTLFRFLVGTEANSVVALSMYTYHLPRRLGFLWYMATHPLKRSQGMGTLLFQETMSALNQDAVRAAGAPPLGMCWEVERPADAPQEAERVIRERRIRFYQRNGGILLDGIDFTAPPLAADLPPVSFYLMFAPAGDTPLTPALQREIIDLLLLDSYGVAADSPYYQKAIPPSNPDGAAIRL